MSTPQAVASTSTDSAAKRRGYRACLACRSKKSKCDLGDPDSPSVGPCRRCRRELRECVFSASEKPFARKAGGLVTRPSLPSPSLPMDTSTSARRPSYNPGAGSHTSVQPETPHEGYGDGDEEEEDQDQAGPSQGDIGNILYNSSLNNPADALRMLATASTLNSPHPTGGGAGPHPRMPSRNNSDQPDLNLESGWTAWSPIVMGILSQEEAQQLFSLFQLQMQPLYPLLPDEIFLPQQLASLTSTEYLLLGTMVSIAARYAVSTLAAERQAMIHAQLAGWLRREIAYIYDGSPVLRHLSSVESLLLLAEWPTTVTRHPFLAGGPRPDPQDIPSILSSSTQYDSLSWSYIGCAVRLAQELGIDNPAHYATPNTNPSTWMQRRTLGTWIFAYNADRHVSVRLGRNTVIQNMSSQWWEKVCKIASDNFFARGFKDEWAEPMPQGFIASLIGTIQDRLYPNREITRASLKTGYWEGFLRSLSHELQHMKRSSESIIKQGNIASTLLLIELDYLLLYANTIALRALQARSQRRVKANDIFSISATLLNLQEGPWVIESIAAAQSILRATVEILHHQGFLRLAPARIFQRIVFAATFLFKSLAVGVVEHGQGNVLQLLDNTILALEQSSLDPEHLAAGFAALLRRLQVQYNQPGRISESSTPTYHQPAAEYSPFETLKSSSLDLGGGLPPLSAPPFQWMPDRNLMAMGEQQDVLFHSLWASDAYSSNTSLIETLCGDVDFGGSGMQF